jgi:hypothetical protein
MKSKSFQQTIDMIERLIKIRNEKIKELTYAHPVIIIINGMLSALTWVCKSDSTLLEDWLKDEKL